ncbi:hypothetical protein ACOX9X_07100 [Photobacterium leiognathi subsp. mandapamensis]|uniref:hypothetical protein n=1 Tax=Photobacterium leiognathi TaxID=553611 RepID=UPI003BF58427
MYKYLLLVLVLFSLHSHAEQEELVESADRHKRAEIEVLKDNIRVLEAQNEILKSSSKDIQLMYLAALGFSATFLITFLGVNVYFSRTKFEEERKSLENLYEVKSKEQLMKLEETLHSSINEVKESIPTTVSQKIKPLTGSLERYSKKLEKEKLRVDLELIILTIGSTTTESTLVRLYIEAASLANQREQDWRVGDFLLEADQLLSKGAKIGSLSVADTMVTLRTFPKHHEKLVSSIETKLVKNKQVA